MKTTAALALSLALITSSGLAQSTDQAPAITDPEKPESIRPSGQSDPDPRAPPALQPQDVPRPVSPNGDAALRPTSKLPQLIEAAPTAAPPPEPLPQIELREREPVAAAIDLTNPPDDLWIRIRNGFAMPNLSNELVLHHQAWYLNRPDLVRRIVERSGRYLHFIVEELEKKGMPTELALLPMIESSYNPMALSPARASGLWQFIPSTGRTYKLEQNAWIDERRDIVASTGAALDYLQTIYEMHGDWHLALASYNWGENAVARAIAKNTAKGLPTDYLSLNMPAETRNYVPKLQALKNILANPRLFAQLELPRLPNRPYFSTIAKPATMDIRIAAKLAEMPLNEFVALNPANNRPVIREQQRLVLPADRVELFNTNLENHSAPLSSWKPYTLKAGERLEQIAARHGMSVAQLKQANGIGRKTKTTPGTTILLPADKDALSELHRMPRVPVDPPNLAKKSGKGKQAGRSAVRVQGSKTSKTVRAKAPGGKKPVKRTTTNRSATKKKSAANP